MIIQTERDVLELYSLFFGFLCGIVLNIFTNGITKKLDFSKKKYFSKYFFFEISTSLITLILYLKMGFNVEFLYTLLLIYTMLVLSVIDFRYKMVPDYLLLLLFILAFFATSLPFAESLKSAFILAGFFALLEFVLTFYIQNIKSKLTNDESLKSQKALGEGDIPVVATIGAVLGVKSAVIAIFLGALFAIIPALYLGIKKKDSQTPFIPFLFLGFLFEFFINLSTKVFS